MSLEFLVSAKPKAHLLLLADGTFEIRIKAVDGRLFVFSGVTLLELEQAETGLREIFSPLGAGGQC